MTDALMSKGLPVDVELEKLVLAAVIKNAADNLGVAIELLAPDDFSTDANRLIWNQVCRMADEGEKIDVVTVCKALMAAGRLEAAGGIAYITELDNGLPTVYHLDAYCESLSRKAVLRRAILCAHAGIQRLCEPGATLEDLEEFKGVLGEIEDDSKKRKGGFRHISEIVHDEEAGGATEFMNPRVELTGVPWPWEGLNRMVGFLAPGQVVCVSAGTGVGKCLGKDTPVLMASGEIKPVQDIEAGELVMGPDSKPRHVLSVCTGTERLYRIKPVKGDSWVCNEAHILSLVCNADKGELSRGQVVNISVGEYLKLSKTKKHILKLWRTGVEFERSDVPLDPYFLGLWLGDGNSDSVRITNSDIEVTDFLQQYAISQGMKCGIWRDPRSRAVTHSVTTAKGVDRKVKRCDTINAKLRSLGVFKNKHIPNIYLRNDRQTRLSLLAGIIDSDGYLVHNCYEIVTTSYQLAYDILYLCRSLGMAAYFRQSKVAFRINISGELDEVPCLVGRRKARKRQQRKDVRRVGFSVEPIGEGQYFGFELSGPDRLFLLGDFTVTHNTTLATQTALWAVERNFCTALLTLEMTGSEQAKKIIAQHGGVCLSDWLRGQSSPADRKKIVKATSTLLKTPLFFDDRDDVTPAMLRTAIERMKIPPALIVVDYAQLMDSGIRDRSASREQHVAHISRTIKKLAKRFGCAFIVLSQLNEEGKTRESRALEHDATFHLKLDRKPQGVYHLSAPKARFAAFGRHIVMRLDGETGLFTEVESE